VCGGLGLIMKSFLDKVQILLTQKTASELNAFVLRIAEYVPEENQSEFLELLENKRIIISEIGRDNLDVEKILVKINQFSENIEEYEIEAYYEDRWDYEGYHIEKDDGFCKDLSECYHDAVKLLNHGFYHQAAKAFRTISIAVEAFDGYNENNDYRAIYVQTFADEKWLDFDLTKISIYWIYSALLSESFCEHDIFASYTWSKAT
jgi:hypothetical protein